MTTAFFYLLKGSKMTNYYDLFKVCKRTTMFAVLFKVSKMTNYYDFFKVGKMTTVFRLNQS